MKKIFLITLFCLIMLVGCNTNTTNPNRSDYQQEVIELAKQYGVDVEAASIAGLCHDYAKQRADEDFIKVIKAKKLDPDLLNYGNAIWHGFVGAEMVKDMNDLLVSVWTNSANVHVPGVLLLPSDKWAIASSKRMDTGTDTTVMEFFRLNNLYTGLTGQEIEIRPILELQTAGASSKPRMMAYEKNPDNLTLRQPIPWRSLAPQPTGLRIEVPCEYKTSGVEFRYPGSAGYKDML